MGNCQEKLRAAFKTRIVQVFGEGVDAFVTMRQCWQDNRKLCCGICSKSNNNSGYNMVPLHIMCMILYKNIYVL